MNWGKGLKEDERQLLIDLIKIESPSTGETQVAKHLCDWLSSRGIRSRVDQVGNVIATWGKGKRTLCLLGHMDTVLPILPVALDDASITGRGAVDAKGPLAAMASALGRVAEREDEPDGHRVLLVGAVEEEIPGSRGAKHLAKRLAKTPPIATVIGEPSGWDRITLGYRGCLRMKLATTAPIRHSATPHGTAAEQGVDDWLRILEMARAYNEKRDDPHSLFSELSPTLLGFSSRIRGGVDEAELDISLRTPLGISSGTLFEALKDNLTGHLTLFGAQAAYRSSRNTPLIRGFLRAIRSLGGRPTFSLKSGTSDMNVVGPEWQTSMVAYGPGDPQLSHTIAERIRFDEYERGILVLEQLLMNLP